MNIAFDLLMVSAGLSIGAYALYICRKLHTSNKSELADYRKAKYGKTGSCNPCPADMVQLIKRISHD